MGQPVFAFVFTSPSQFVPLGPGQSLCTPDIVMFDDGGGDVTLTGTPDHPPIFLPVPPGGPYVKTKQVQPYAASTAIITVNKDRSPAFTFAVCDGSGNYQIYVLGGIALRNMKQGGGTGVAEFPCLNINVNNGATMMHLPDENKDCNTYEFFVMVQNASGDVGLIDPRIVNQS